MTPQTAPPGLPAPAVHQLEFHPAWPRVPLETAAPARAVGTIMQAYGCLGGRGERGGEWVESVDLHGISIMILSWTFMYHDPKFKRATRTQSGWTQLQPPPTARSSETPAWPRCPHRCDAPAAGAGAADRPAPRGVTGAGALSVSWRAADQRGAGWSRVLGGFESMGESFGV